MLQRLRHVQYLECTLYLLAAVSKRPFHPLADDGDAGPCFAHFCCHCCDVVTDHWHSSSAAPSTSVVYIQLSRRNHWECCQWTSAHRTAKYFAFMTSFTMWSLITSPHSLSGRFVLWRSCLPWLSALSEQHLQCQHGTPVMTGSCPVPLWLVVQDLVSHRPGDLWRQMSSLPHWMTVFTIGTRRASCSSCWRRLSLSSWLETVILFAVKLSAKAWAVLW